MNDTNGVLKDVGPNKLDGKINEAISVAGKTGKALEFRDGKNARVDDNDILNGSDKFTLSLWMRIDKPSENSGGVVAKRDQNSAAPFILSVGKDNKMGFEGFNGSDWFGLWLLALTPAQKEDAKIKVLVAKLTKWLEAKSRKVEIGNIEPNGVILSPQPLKTSQSFPRWRTVESDLVLLGAPQDNLLIFDQMRGGLLDDESGAVVTYSPFVGEFNALNIVGDTARLEGAR